MKVVDTMYRPGQAWLPILVVLPSRMLAIGSAFARWFVVRSRGRGRRPANP
jgi:hypothetical protein